PRLPGGSEGFLDEYAKNGRQPDNSCRPKTPGCIPVPDPAGAALARHAGSDFGCRPFFRLVCPVGPALLLTLTDRPPRQPPGVAPPGREVAFPFWLSEHRRPQ